jgi:hypothetical protein
MQVPALENSLLGFQLAQEMEIASCGGDLAAPPGVGGMFSKSYPATVGG